MNPLETITAYITAARAGDFDRAFDYFHADIRFRVPGKSSWAGEHVGRAKARAYIDHARAISHDADVEVELVDMLASGERVALLVDERFHRNGMTIVIRRSNVYRIVDGQIVEVWIYEADQYAVDALIL